MSGLKSVCVLVVSLVVQIDGSAESVKDFSTGFMKALQECKTELNLTDKLLTDLYRFWKDDASLSRDIGCAIYCMSQKLDIVDSSGKLHHGNAKEFALQNGANDEIATKLVSIIHECEKRFDSETDSCLRTLDIAKCFKNGVKDLNWAPDVDVIVAEVLTEI